VTYGFLSDVRIFLFERIAEPECDDREPSVVISTAVAFYVLRLFFFIFEVSFFSMDVAYLGNLLECVGVPRFE